LKGLRGGPVNSHRGLVLVLLGAVGALAAAVLLWHARAGAGRGVELSVRGGDGGGLPVESAATEHLDGPTLARIAQDPAAVGLQALLIMRHGHLVYSQYGNRIGADTVIDSGGFARVLVALAAGIASDERQLGDAPAVFQPDALRSLIEVRTGQRYPDWLGNRLWARLNAAPAWIEAPTSPAPAPADCCFHARIADWLRVGELLANAGSFEDASIVSRSWIERMRQPQASGAEGYGVMLPAQRADAQAYEATDLLLLRGPGRWRLWVVPSLRLVVLFGAGPASSWDETRVPNLVIEAVSDRPAPAATPLQQLVHGH
jgi:hypothetical protein